MNIALKDKIKIDNNFINDLISKSWQDSESIQNQINSIDATSPKATKVVKLLKDLLTSYYVFTGCLENLEFDPNPEDSSEPKSMQQEEPVDSSEISVVEPVLVTDVLDAIETETVSEPFEYFVDFDEPTGEPLTDDDLYN